jgi:hypothetical protein
MIYYTSDEIDRLNLGSIFYAVIFTQSLFVSQAFDLKQLETSGKIFIHFLLVGDDTVSP